MFKNRNKDDFEDIHIKILRYALVNPGFTHSELIKTLSLTYDQQVFIGTDVSGSSPFFTHIGGKTDTDGQSIGYKYMLSFEGRSRLLEYDELKEARQNARGAFWMARLHSLSVV
jgi:hypothetical protein